MPNLKETVPRVESLRPLIVIKNRKIYLWYTERTGAVQGPVHQPLDPTTVPLAQHINLL
jgi:hypothetical protein